MDEELRQRIGANEVMFRDVNEGIARGQWPGEEDAPVGFRCECARLGCNEMVEITPREYEGVRANPRWFVVVPGHEMPQAETVISEMPGYVVVEKNDEAGRLAEALDPRG